MIEGPGVDRHQKEATFPSFDFEQEKEPPRIAGLPGARIDQGQVCPETLFCF